MPAKLSILISQGGSAWRWSVSASGIGSLLLSWCTGTAIVKVQAALRYSHVCRYQYTIIGLHKAVHCMSISPADSNAVDFHSIWTLVIQACCAGPTCGGQLPARGSWGGKDLNNVFPFFGQQSNLPFRKYLDLILSIIVLQVPEDAWTMDDQLPLPWDTTNIVQKTIYNRENNFTREKSPCIFFWPLMNW